MFPVLPTSVSKAMRAGGKELTPHPQTTPVFTINTPVRVSLFNTSSNSTAERKATPIGSLVSGQGIPPVYRRAGGFYHYAIIAVPAPIDN